MHSVVASMLRRARVPGAQGCRFISVGTDLKASQTTWQLARPWHMSDEEGSNLSADNAQTMTDIFGGGKTVAVFGVPAPFTGTCSNEHYPPYLEKADEFASAGVDKLICYSVADPYAHKGWSKSLGNDDTKILFLADPECEWAKEHDLDRDYSVASLGVRSARFSMLVKDGIVKSFNMVEDAAGDAGVLLEDAKKLG